MTQRRHVHVLAPDESGTHLMTTMDGALPVADLEFDDRVTTAQALDQWMRARDIDATLVDCWIDQTSTDDDGTVHVAVEVQLDAVPEGWRWTRLDDVHVDVVAGLQPYTSGRLAEWRGVSRPASRSSWVERDWARSLHGWIDEQLGSPSRLVPFRLWGISAVWRVETAADTLWCKAVYPGFAAEPAVTRVLDELAPGRVPRVVATDDDRSVVLMAAVPGSSVAVQVERTDDAIGALVGLQRDLVDHRDTLLAAGAAHRPLVRLADDLAAVLAERVVRDLVQEVAPLDEPDVEAVLRSVRAAVATVGMLGLPETLAHGDFHAANVLIDGDRVVIIDWSDAAWTHPLVDVGAWAAWFRDAPDTVDALWRSWATAWGVRPDRLDAVRPALTTVVAAYHVVSYAHIALGLEPLRQHEAASGVRNFWADLLGIAVD